MDNVGQSLGMGGIGGRISDGGGGTDVVIIAVSLDDAASMKGVYYARATGGARLCGGPVWVEVNVSA
jgi:hypothetical protein